MQKPVKSRTAERDALNQRKTARRIEEEERVRQDRTKQIRKLREMRLAKEAEEKSGSDKAASADLPEVHRPQS